MPPQIADELRLEEFDAFDLVQPLNIEDVFELDDEEEEEAISGLHSRILCQKFPDGTHVFESEDGVRHIFSFTKKGFEKEIFLSRLEKTKKFVEDNDLFSLYQASRILGNTDLTEDPVIVLEVGAYSDGNGRLCLGYRPGSTFVSTLQMLLVDESFDKGGYLALLQSFEYKY